LKLGILALGRPTFDVAYAEQKLAAMLDALRSTGHEVIGSSQLLLDEESTRAEIGFLRSANPDRVLILQVTFTDASMAVAAGNTFEQPLLIWAVPEPRLGGRLRLNAFCGLNLASHALGLNGREFSWLYADPEQDVATDLLALINGERLVGKLTPDAPPEPTAEGRAIVEAIYGRRIAKIGEHPQGFDTCAYDPLVLKKLTGVEVDDINLNTLFETARTVPAETAATLRCEVDDMITGLDEVDQQALDRSLRLKAGLDKLRVDGQYDAFAIRCWPETFTEYGGAVCAPAALLGEERVPCACEADVFGALTQLVLKEASRQAVFLTDLVDMDNSDNTGVVWHCGQAPISMRDPDTMAEATIHTNRKQPLLLQFPLKPGPVTLLRVSQSHGSIHIILGKGEMLQRPMAFTGTSGVLRFSRPVNLVLHDIMASGIEHHMALAYGDHREALRGFAGAMNLPLLEL